MKYKSDKPIYLQIADFICNQIIQNNWKETERILSVRDLSSQLGVNPNTVVRAFENIENLGIIHNKRGIGFFVSQEAKNKITEIYKQEFFAETLPELFKKMKLLNISIDEINQEFSKI